MTFFEKSFQFISQNETSFSSTRIFKLNLLHIRYIFSYFFYQACVTNFSVEYCYYLPEDLAFSTPDIGHFGQISSTKLGTLLHKVFRRYGKNQILKKKTRRVVPHLQTQVK